MREGVLAVRKMASLQYVPDVGHMVCTTVGFSLGPDLPMLCAVQIVQESPNGLAKCLSNILYKEAGRVATNKAKL